MDIISKVENLTKKDLGTWRAAHQLAINVENPQRCRLYEVYADCMLDGHLSGIIEQRKNMVLGKRFKLTNSDDKEVYKATTLLKQEWFYNFLSLALDSIYWGHSLIFLGDVIRDGGVMRYSHVELVPRKHVIPEYGVIVREQGDEPKKGTSYRDGDYASWLIEVGNPYNLGLLLKCAIHCLPKKNMFAFWDAFGEVFGMPLRVVKMATRDEKERDKMERKMQTQGALTWLIASIDTEVEIKGNDRGDAYNVYDKRIERANSELSKCILTQTMTSDNGSSRSQSEVHEDMLRSLIKSDANLIHYLINGRLLPLMASHGFPVAGLTFEWDDTHEYTPSEIREVERMLEQSGYEIDPQYYIERYNIPILGRKASDPSGVNLKHEELHPFD